MTQFMERDTGERNYQFLAATLKEQIARAETAEAQSLRDRAECEQARREYAARMSEVLEAAEQMRLRSTVDREQDIEHELKFMQLRDRLRSEVARLKEGTEDRS